MQQRTEIFLKKRSLSLWCLQCVPRILGFMPEEGPAPCHPATAFQTSPCQMGYYKNDVTCSKTANSISLCFLTGSNIMYSLWKKVSLDQPTLRSGVIFRVLFISRKPLKSQQRSLTLVLDVVQSAGSCGPDEF